MERLLGPERLAQHRVTGLVSVPAGCGRRLAAIEVRETRPAKANLPTPAVVQATREIMTTVSQLGPQDLAIAVITGGGSALLAAPREGISLDEKIAITRQLSESGADIATLNATRRGLSLVKGGGLAKACTAGNLLVLVLSDVIGDDLDVIASGPCMPPEPSTPPGTWTTPGGCHVRHVIVGDNGTAVAAAAASARQAGYLVVQSVADGGQREASAEAVGARLVIDAVELMAVVRRDGRPRALIVGGEATVTVPADHGLGGRNQQTVLAAINAMQQTGAAWPAGLLIASVGTDGEDGPTDAAGGCADAAVVAEIARRDLDVPRAIARCDAHPLLAAAGGLIRTGPTGTNVADIRIVLARP
jgi:glycerate 2-kinase